MALHEYAFMSVKDYLILDQNSKETRYEYLDGTLRMLAGGSTYYSRITINFASALHEALNEGSCYVYSSDIRLQLSESRYVYPDVTVSCDERDDTFDEMIRYPCLVVEVLSPSTEAFDRGKKFFYYRECPTIQEYVMVDSQSILVEVYRRESDGWKLHTFGPGSNIILESLTISFSVDSLYKGMNFTELRARKHEEN